MAAIAVKASSSTTVLIQADPQYCSFLAVAPMGASTPGGATSLVANANYYYSGQPIGAMANQGYPLPSSPLPVNKPRTALVIRGGQASLTEPLTSAGAQELLQNGAWANAVVIQAGPRIVRDGQATLANTENFQDDVYRKTRHVGIGITAAGKLLFRYVSNHKLATLAQMLADDGAVHAINVDGGHAACLRFGATKRGAVKPYTALVVTPVGP